MIRTMLFTLALVGLVANQVLAGPITYVDATPNNTTLGDGTALNMIAGPATAVTAGSPPQDVSTDGTGATGNSHWHNRTGFGNGGAVFTARTLNTTPGVPELRTLMSGLIPGATYDVYAYSWVAEITSLGDMTLGSDAAWDIAAGLQQGNTTEFLWNEGTQLPSDSPPTNPATPINNSTDFTTPVLVIEGNRWLFQYSLGQGIANGAGEIPVYINDYPMNDDRTWYDGVGHSFVVPEPGSVVMALFAMCAAGVVTMRRRLG